MLYKPRRRILPRRERPEIAAVRDRLLARRAIRFMRRYTDIPVGVELPLTAQLLRDICLARELMFSALPGHVYSMQRDRQMILGAEDVTEPDAGELARALAELCKIKAERIVVDEDIVRELNDLLNQYAFEQFIAGHLHTEDPGNATGLHHRGHARLELNDFAGALDDYSEAIELEPGSAMYLQSRAKCFTRLHRHAEAATDLFKAEKLCLAQGDLLDLCLCRAALCEAWGKLGSVYDFILAAERFLEIAAHITLSAEWSPDGDGELGSYIFPGVRILEQILAVEKLLQENLQNVVDQRQRRSLAELSQKLVELRRMY